jgi:hypothetical protein
LSEKEFNKMMEKGLAQVKADESVSVSEAFAIIRAVKNKRHRIKYKKKQ